MKSEVGSRNSELGSRNSELGSRNLELGSRKLEVGTKKSEIRSPYPAFVSSSQILRQTRTANKGHDYIISITSVTSCIESS